MGMFDEILVPKSYLKGLLEKKYEKCLKSSHVFQTKDFDNMLDMFKVYKQSLYLREDLRWGDALEDKPRSKPKWKKTNLTTTVNFYDAFDFEDADLWMEFEFSFVDGKLDKKKLVKCEVSRTKEEKEELNKMFEIEHKFYDDFRNRISTKIYSWIARKLHILFSWFDRKSVVPQEIRDKAQKASGRAKKHPDLCAARKKSGKPQRLSFWKHL